MPPEHDLDGADTTARLSVREFVQANVRAGAIRERTGNGTRYSPPRGDRDFLRRMHREARAICRERVSRTRDTARPNATGPRARQSHGSRHGGRGDPSDEPEPPGGRQHNQQGAEQATRKRGKRGKGRRIRREIERKARERQAAWGEGDRANTTARLTADLNGPEHVTRPEGLYAELREARRGEGQSYSGRTWGPR